MQLTLQFNIKQSPAQQWAVAWAIQVKSWPLMHTSLCCPDDVKTMAGNDANGDLEKRKHCMESHESLADNGSKWEQEQWNTSYWQQSRPRPDASVRKKKNWLFGPLSCWSQGYSPPGCSKASSYRDGGLNSNSWALIFFRHLFALGLPDVSCLASAHS